MPEKSCSKCRKVQPLTEYHRIGERYRPDCKSCRKAQKDAYRARPDIRAREAERSADPDVIRQRVEWRMQNPHREWEKSYRKRGGQYGVPLVVVSFTKEELVAAYGDACYWCKDGAFEELDHVVAVRDGGEHTIENARPSCISCNRSRDAAKRIDRKVLTPGQRVAIMINRAGPLSSADRAVIMGALIMAPDAPRVFDTPSG